MRMQWEAIREGHWCCRMCAWSRWLMLWWHACIHATCTGCTSNINATWPVSLHSSSLLPVPDLTGHYCRPRFFDPRYTWRWLWQGPSILWHHEISRVFQTFNPQSSSTAAHRGGKPITFIVHAQYLWLDIVLLILLSAGVRVSLWPPSFPISKCTWGQEG